MNRQQAQNIIKETFESPFDKVRFTDFIKNLLNRVDDASFIYQGNYIPDAYKQYIKTLERIGKFSDEENRIDILVITLQKYTSLERARTMQRNFIAWYLNGSRGGVMKDAALAAFVSPGKEDWRFSLVKMDYKFEQTKSGSMKVKEEFTPARRWSFLVGANEKSHTAQSRLVNILADDEQAPTLEEIEKAFDIETVTKEFFLKYRELFLRTKEELDRVVRKDPKIKADFKAKGVDTVNFAKKLLGQIIFLYFLQKKGWFGVGRDNDWGTGSKHFLRELFEKKHGDYNNFYNDILEPLFYEALRIDRSHDDGYYSRFNCKIPFLNGGLFDPIGNYDWVHTDILIPDRLFSNNVKTKEGDKGTGILDIFDRYNFTVKEDEPLEKEVAIDPELLGKSYEKFNAIRPDNYAEFKKALKSGKKGEENKFNKKFGVYYTPREIVHYMCQQSLINYLATELEGKAKKEAIEFFILEGEKYIEHLKTAKEKKEKNANYQGDYKEKEHFIELKKHASEIDNSLSKIKVCDPAVGSGAFPVGMMTEIVKARMFFIETGCLEKSYITSHQEEEKRTPYNFKRDCIEYSLYGVDIDPGAVEIAKLRLWLSLVVDEEDIKNIKPLPNLDYRIMQGNSLISEFMGINFDDDENKNLKEKISDLNVKIGELDKKIKEKEKEQIQFYNNHYKQDENLSKILENFTKEKRSIVNKISRINKEIEKNNQKYSRLSEILEKFQQKKDEFLNESNVSRKTKLKEEVDDLLVKIFETKLRTQKADYFNRSKNIINKYSGLRNEKQRDELIKQEKEKLNKEFGFDLEEAEKQLKEFTSGLKIKPFFLWNLYFSEVFLSGAKSASGRHCKSGFDVVMANPPYIGEKGHKDIFREIRKSNLKKYYMDKMDIFYFFFHLSLDISKNQSNIAFITTHYYTTATGAKKLRKDLKQRTAIKNLINFNELKIFESAQGQHNMITILKKDKCEELAALNCTTKRKGFATPYILQQILGGIDLETQYFKVPQKELYDGEDNYIRLCSYNEGSNDLIKVILTKIKSTSTYVEKFCNVNKGVYTGSETLTRANKVKYSLSNHKIGEGVFVLKNTELSALMLSKSEKRIIKPFFKNSDIAKYYTSQKNSLNLINLVYTERPDLDDYPNLKKHLLRFKTLLSDRPQTGTLHSALNNGYWYVLSTSRKVNMDGPKIIAPYRTKTNSFGYNEVPWYGGSDVYYITEKDNTISLKYVLSILNSKLCYLWLYHKGKKKGEILELTGKPIQEIPIKKVTKKEQQPFINIVDWILLITRDDYMQNPQKQAKVKSLEAEIDQLVYKLYDLTLEEIKIVEGTK